MKFKVGDKIRCLPGFNTDGDWSSDKSGGSAYIDGMVYTVKRISPNSGYNEVLWLEENQHSGVFSQAVVLDGETHYEIY